MSVSDSPTPNPITAEIGRAHELIATALDMIDGIAATLEPKSAGMNIRSLVKVTRQHVEQIEAALASCEQERDEKENRINLLEGVLHEFDPGLVLAGLARGEEAQRRNPRPRFATTETGGGLPQSDPDHHAGRPDVEQWAEVARLRQELAACEQHQQEMRKAMYAFLDKWNTVKFHLTGMLTVESIASGIKDELNALRKAAASPSPTPERTR